VGMLPATPFDRTIDLACEKNNIYTLPDELRIKLMLHRYCHRLDKLVCNIASEPPEMQIPERDQDIVLPWQKDLDHLEMELNAIEREFASKLTG
jgi:hypothetical protein